MGIIKRLGAGSRLKGRAMKKTCIGCSRFKKYNCGQLIIQRPTSSSARYMSVPDKRCKKEDP